MKSSSLLLLMSLLLLAQLALRVHNITALPVFTDEYSHIRRAAVIYDFEQHPAVNSHGKFLFYFLPGIFNLKDTHTALHLARVSVALASLLTTALIFLMMRHLFEVRAGIIAAAIYAFAPYAFFFERMALADPAVGLVATVTVWLGILFAQRPTRSRAFWLGLFVAMTPATKLTMSFVTLTPLLTILIIGQGATLAEKFRRYFPLLLISGGVIVVFWGAVLIPAIIQYYDGVNYTFYDNWLLDPNAETVTLFDKVDQWWEKMALLFSIPMTLLWFMQGSIAAYRTPRRTSVLLCWLAMAWLPMFFVVAPGSFQSRYLMAGLPAAAALFGAGAIQCWDLIFRQPRWSFAAVSTIIAAWIGTFVLPFTVTALNRPAELRLPPQDQKDYVAGWFNGYGLIPAVRYLQNGVFVPDESFALLHTRYCLPEVYNFDPVRYTCNRSRDYLNEPLPLEWAQLQQALQDQPFVYVISDVYTDTPPSGNQAEWAKLATFHKPVGDIRFTVWRLTLAE